jgi:hypothetical protein
VGECFLPGFVFPSHLLSFNLPFTSDGLQAILPGVEFPSPKHTDKEEFFQTFSSLRTTRWLLFVFLHPSCSLQRWKQQMTLCFYWKTSSAQHQWMKSSIK